MTEGIENDNADSKTPVLDRYLAEQTAYSAPSIEEDKPLTREDFNVLPFEDVQRQWINEKDPAKRAELRELLFQILLRDRTRHIQKIQDLECQVREFQVNLVKRANTSNGATRLRGR